MLALLLPLLPALVRAQCPGGLSPSEGIRPSVASGFAYATVATGLASPRSLQFDAAGNLLVLEKGKGLTSWTVRDSNSSDRDACGVALENGRTLIDNEDLNHGLALSPNGSTVYVSTPGEALAYGYDARTNAVSGEPRTLVRNMANSAHSTRTLLAPANVSGSWLVVSRGSGSNLDYQTAFRNGGRSQVRAFDLAAAPRDGYNYNRDGTLMGWGLRNSVGVAQHPATGGIWTVENSADNIRRLGQDVHTDNPGEELNFVGYVNGTGAGQNYGYPFCFAAWRPEDLPENGNLTVGSAFNAEGTDCSNTTAPRLIWQAHTAPIDIKFNNSGSQAWVSFHGSWNREPAAGYNLAYIQFGANGEPVRPATANDSAISVLANTDVTRCPENCFRPAGLAFDARGRLFMTSDSTGEIYVVVRTTADLAASPTSGGAPDTSAPGSSPTATAAASAERGKAWLLISVALFFMAL